jgi:glutamate formiminotransferase
VLAVPNFSEGREVRVIKAIATAIESEPGVSLFDIHTDPDHNRSVYTLAGTPGGLGGAIVRAAGAAIELIDLAAHDGAHPKIGSLDVAPIVFLNRSERGSACAEALVLADRLGHELSLPVFLYGALTENTQTRADLRRGGPQQLRQRIEAGELKPVFGPSVLHASAGAVLVGARPPLIAFNVELAPPADAVVAQQIARLIREGGAEGLPGVRAIGLTLPARGGVAQVSMNIEDCELVTPAEVVHAIARHAEPLRAELIGLAPRAAFADFPGDLPVIGLRHIEDFLH